MGFSYVQGHIQGLGGRYDVLTQTTVTIYIMYSILNTLQRRVACTEDIYVHWTDQGVACEVDMIRELDVRVASWKTKAIWFHGLRKARNHPARASEQMKLNSRSVTT